MHPTRGHARDLILATADRLFYRDGIRATSVDAIADEAGVTKRTLYHHFASKDELVATYLMRRDAVVRERFVTVAEAARATPHERILAVFDAIAASARNNDFRGCAFLNAVAQCGDDGNVRAASITHKDAIEGWFRTQLGSQPDAATCAAMLMVLYDGALARALLYRCDVPVRAARAAAELLLAGSSR